MRGVGPPEGPGAAVTDLRPGPATPGPGDDRPRPAARRVPDGLLRDRPPRRLPNHSGPIEEALRWHDPARTREDDDAPVPASHAAPIGEDRIRYLPALDGLRAVSVAAVLAYHLGRLRGGFLGVDVFFVVSGFLITRLLLLEHEDTDGIGLRSFWLRRFRRLVPALLLVLVAVSLASRSWLQPWRMGDIRADSFAALSYVANWRFIASGQSYFTTAIGPSPLRHTWSLAIEEQFYLVWPLLVVGLAMWARRHRLAVLALSTVGAVASAGWMAVAAGSAGDLTSVYFATPSRAFALLAGASVAAWWDPVVADGPRPPGGGPRPISRLAVPACALLVASFFVGDNESVPFYRGGFQVVAVLAALAVVALATGDGAVARLLGSAPLRWVGRRSYGIYLWSWPVQVFASEHFRYRGATLEVLVVVLSVGLATLSFWLVEEPIRTGRRPVGLERLRLPSLEGVTDRVPGTARSILGVGAAVAVISAAAAGAPPPPEYVRVSDREAIDAALAAPTTVDDPAVTGPTMASTTPSSTPGSGRPGPFDLRAGLVVDPTVQVDPSTVRGRPLRVMIAGDSVGWSLGWRLLDTLTPSVRVSDRAIIGCGLMPADSAWIVGVTAPETYPATCQRAGEAELIGLQEQPDVVLLWVGAWEVYDHEYQGQRLDVGSKRYATLLEQRIQQRIDLFRSAGVPTLMPVVPCFGEIAQRLGLERYDTDRLGWVNARLRAVASRNPGWVRMIDPRNQLCSSSGEARETTETGMEIRGDGAHFGAESATWFWNTWLAGQVAAAFAPAPG